MSPSPDILTTQEALAILEVSRPTLYALMKRGQIESIAKPTPAKKRPRLLFRREDVERLALPIQRAG